MALNKSTIKQNIDQGWFISYKEYVRGVLLPARTGLKDLDYWRNEIFYRILVYFTPLSIIALIPGVYMAYAGNVWIVGVVDILSFILLIMIMLVRNISLPVRKFIFISVFYLLSVVLLCFLGMMGPGRLFLLALPILSSIIYSSRAGYVSAFINVIICVAFSILNYMDIPIRIVLDYSLGAWIAVSSNLVLLSFGCSKCLELLIGGLSASLLDNRVSEEKIKKTNRLYHFLSKINQHIILIKDESILFQNCCSTALEIGKFKMAWIGRAATNEKRIDLIEQSGIPENERHRFSLPYQVGGPQEHVLNSGTYFVCNNIENAIELNGWRSFIKFHGIRSFMILPIEKCGLVVGTYNLYSTDVDFFDKEEIKLLVEATENISFALDNYDGERKRKVLEAEQIKIRNKVEQSENKFRQIVETAQEGIWLIDEKEKTTFVNSKMCNILEYAENEMLSKDPFHFMDEEGKEIAKAAILRKRNGIVGHSEFKYVSKSGKEVWTMVAANPLFNESGIYNGSLAMVTDMTEYKKAEESIMRSEARLNEAQEIVHLGNWEIRFDTNNGLWSKEACRIFDLSPDDNLKSVETWLSFIHPDDLDSVLKITAEARKTLVAPILNYRILLKDGRMKHIYSKSRFELNKKGAAVGLHGIMLDVSERKVAEEEREKIMINLVEKSKKLEQFTFIVSHNLRAPVAQILGLSHVLKNRISETDRALSEQFLFRATEQLDIILKDLNKILDVRFEVSEHKEPVFLNELVHEISGSISKLIEKEKVKIEIDFSAVGKIVSVKTYMYSVFYNLILNSIKYKQRDKPPSIRIASEANGKTVKISFKDNGVGIDLIKHGGKIFGLYQRFNLDGDGKGLGLYMVKTQVEALGGVIRVESKEGNGAEFIIELPL